MKNHTILYITLIIILLLVIGAGGIYLYNIHQPKQETTVFIPSDCFMPVSFKLGTTYSEAEQEFKSIGLDLSPDNFDNTPRSSELFLSNLNLQRNFDELNKLKADPLVANAFPISNLHEGGLPGANTSSTTSSTPSALHGYQIDLRKSMTKTEVNSWLGSNYPDLFDFAATIPSGQPVSYTDRGWSAGGSNPWPPQNPNIVINIKCESSVIQDKIRTLPSVKEVMGEIISQ